MEKDILKEYLKDLNNSKEYLNENLKYSNQADFIFALRNVALAQIGIAKLSNKTGLGREGLYKSLSPMADPYLSTILKILDVLNLTIEFTFKENDKKINNNRLNSIAEIFP